VQTADPRRGGTIIRLSGRRIRALLLTPAVLFLFVLPATAARADSPISSADLDCVITFTVDINPGITPEVSHVALTTHGLTATAECTGTVDAATVTGTGTAAINAPATADCTTISGQGEFILRVPTTDGTRTVTGTIIFVGTAISGDINGTGEVLALVGDCVTTPRTSVTATRLQPVRPTHRRTLRKGSGLPGLQPRPTQEERRGGAVADAGDADDSECPAAQPRRTVTWVTAAHGVAGRLVCCW
jgi:hypothetical protein